MKYFPTAGLHFNTHRLHSSKEYLSNRISALFLRPEPQPSLYQSRNIDIQRATKCVALFTHILQIFISFKQIFSFARYKRTVTAPVRIIFKHFKISKI